MKVDKENIQNRDVTKFARQKQQDIAKFEQGNWGRHQSKMVT